MPKLLAVVSLSSLLLMYLATICAMFAVLLMWCERSLEVRSFYEGNEILCRQATLSVVAISVLDMVAQDSASLVVVSCFRLEKRALLSSSKLRIECLGRRRRRRKGSFIGVSDLSIYSLQLFFKLVLRLLMHYSNLEEIPSFERSSPCLCNVISGSPASH